MNGLKDVFRKLREKLFGKGRVEQASAPSVAGGNAATGVRVIPEGLRSDRKRDPYFVQIGFDFGTSYCKCVCRDVMIDKAWIYMPAGSDTLEFPFLIPSVLQLNDGKLCHVEHTRTDYHAHGLYHLKQALVKVALQQWNDPALEPYRDGLGTLDVDRMGALVHVCAVYFLAGVLGEVREHVRRQLPGFGTNAQDYMAVNLAVPVAYAEQHEVIDLYQKVLCEAWIIADQLKGHPILDVEKIDALIGEIKEEQVRLARDVAYVYPETSANVQGFVRSRVSSPGIYLFSDTGAGTVDQSVFIFSRKDNSELLAYLHGSVIPLGSALIEHRAAAAVGKTDWEELESWRVRKENGETPAPLAQAKHWICEGLDQATERTLRKARDKLFVAVQLEEIRVIFGGGGHSEYPYKAAVIRPFSGGLFRHGITPETIGMPVPSDLELETGQARWMRRLSVAYGLSYERNELSTFIYPVQLQSPRPEEIWRPHRVVPEAPSMDEC